MAMYLNKVAGRCEEIAILNGTITPSSSAVPLLYDISRHWRELREATNYRDSYKGKWSEKEKAAGEVIVSALTYLKHIECNDIEKLLRETIEGRARQRK